MFFKLNVFLAILVMWSIHCWIDCGSMDCGGGGGGGDWGGYLGDIALFVCFGECSSWLGS